ncbi:MAG: 2Fe-2S iron-sulfur cluster-binding protein [Anaeromyxobacter sp.]
MRLRDFPTDVTITFDGQPVPARRGESIASALLAAGKPLVSRSAKYHRPRGPFCLAGTCGSCLVRVDGLPSQRACKTPCAEGQVVESQNGLPDAGHDVLGVIDTVYAHGLDHHHLMTWSALANRLTVAASRELAGLGRLPAAAALPPRPAPPEREERWDVLVVGAGPAGLGAAERLVEAGRRVLVAEAEPAAGGRLRCRLPWDGQPGLDWVEAVRARLASGGGELAVRTAVLGLWLDGGSPLALLAQDGAPTRLRLVRPGRVVLCNGGHPLPPALEDGDRPGVFGGRGLALALAEHGVIPGRRAVVLGAGPEPAALAAALTAAGVAVEQVAEAAGRIRGRARVRGLRLPDGRTVPCDVVAVATPPAPATDLGRALGAALTFDGGAQAFALQADAAGRTTAEAVLAAGEVTGAMDARQAADSGRRAGEAARG